MPNRYSFSSHGFNQWIHEIGRPRALDELHRGLLAAIERWFFLTPRDARLLRAMSQPQLERLFEPLISALNAGKEFSVEFDRGGMDAPNNRLTDKDIIRRWAITIKPPLEPS